MRNYPILKTGLDRPRSFQTYFNRERLEVILEKNGDKIDRLVIAGTGYGKSKLVSQWIENKQAVWITGDTRMNIPTIIRNNHYDSFGLNSTQVT